ncbi:MAG: ATP-binding cassette domain-containing protein [Propionibacteriaceae bacterium]|nr:ATP-binding cassette domain-containing protein [Propionibacteriaceae bacterium]
MNLQGADPSMRRNWGDSVAIVVKNVRKTHRGVQTLRGANLTLRESEFCVLLGSDTPGKALLMACLAGVANPDSGSIEINGRDLSRWDQRSGIGAVLKTGLFDDSLTLSRNLLFSARLRRVKGDRRGAMEDICTRLGLGDYLNTPVGNLSVGLRRRANLARALVHRPSFLVLDEPTAGIDPRSAELIWRTIIHELRKGTSVLLSTASTSIAGRAHTVAIMEEGLIVARGKVTSLMDKFGQVSLNDLLQVLSYKSMTSELKGRYANELPVMMADRFSVEESGQPPHQDVVSSWWNDDEELDDDNDDVGIGILKPHRASLVREDVESTQEILEPLDEILGLWEDDTLEVWEGLGDLYQPLSSMGTPLVPRATNLPPVSRPTVNQRTTFHPAPTPSPQVSGPKVLPERLPRVLSTSLASGAQEKPDPPTTNEEPTTPAEPPRLPPVLAASLAAARNRATPEVVPEEEEVASTKETHDDSVSEPTPPEPQEAQQPEQDSSESTDTPAPTAKQSTTLSSTDNMDIGLPEVLRATSPTASSKKSKGLTLNLEGLTKPTSSQPAEPKEEDTAELLALTDVADPHHTQEKPQLLDEPSLDDPEVDALEVDDPVEDDVSLDQQEEAAQEEPDAQPEVQLSDRPEKRQVLDKPTREPFITDVLAGFPPLGGADNTAASSPRTRPSTGSRLSGDLRSTKDSSLSSKTPERRKTLFDSDDEFSQLVELHYRDETPQDSQDPLDHHREVSRLLDTHEDDYAAAMSFEEKFPTGKFDWSRESDDDSWPEEPEGVFTEEQRRQERIHQAVERRLQGARRRLLDPEEHDEYPN